MENIIFGYRWFVDTVKSKGGIWASNDVYFSQMRDVYGANYLPNYPKDSEHDQRLEYNHFTNTWSHYGAKEDV